MAHRRSFLLQNHYFQLEEAVNSIIAEEDDNAYDFLIVAHDLGAITDEEEGPEEDLVAQALPRDVPRNVEEYDVEDYPRMIAVTMSCFRFIPQHQNPLVCLRLLR
ncbi:hypothetical protein HHI36_008776 [Cryptolaemus montrouzieri]|uniref:Uncharacterized protein n=1 Tax=Cryptolaemus montrouzieri TaxID=559131 RepID=A0ABD2MTC2_9CUCU